MSLFIKRFIAPVVEDVSKHFYVMMLTGPRQVGKTSLLKALQTQMRSYVTMDDLNVRIAARTDPEGFLQKLALPALIDEVQYVPELFPYIKMMVDHSKKRGLFWLTGSQQFHLMKNVSESLAGRVAILRLQGISLAEEQERASHLPFLPEAHVLKERQKTATVLTIPEIYHRIWRGSFPHIVSEDGQRWEQFYSSYVSTYIERDVHDYLKIRDQAAFQRFMQLAAARSGQLINYSDLARDVGIDATTLKTWITVLQASGLIVLLQPYFTNRSKRLVKTPKLYFMDTGLCSFLSGWMNPEVLERGAMSGAMLETYVISEIIKSYWHAGKTPRMYFYRDKDKQEIDLLLEENGTLYPIEIKKTASLASIQIPAFEALKSLKTPIGPGVVMCFVKQILPLAEGVDAIPISYV